MHVGWNCTIFHLISASVRVQEIGASHVISACLTEWLPHQTLHLFAAIQRTAQVYQNHASNADGES